MRALAAFGILVGFGAQAYGAAPCLEDGQAVTLSGIVRTKTIPAGPDMARAIQYPMLTFDTPICFKKVGGEVLDGRREAALVSTEASWHPSFRPGRRVKLTGTLGAADNGRQPPEELLLWVGAKAPE